MSTTAISLPAIDLSGLVANMNNVFTTLLPVAVISAGIALAFRVLKGVKKAL